jgi:osmotically-inducible protein OsmY
MSVRKVGLTAIAAAAGTYFFDPQLGRARRAKAKDMLMARAKSTAGELDRQARYAAGTASGKAKRFARSGGNADLENTALARKVESVIFRPEDAPKGRVSVNAEGSVVYLRGEVESREQIDALVHGAESVEGVEEVRNLMHLPGEPAPTKDGPTVAS